MSEKPPHEVVWKGPELKDPNPQFVSQVVVGVPQIRNMEAFGLPPSKAHIPAFPVSRLEQ